MILCKLCKLLKMVCNDGFQCKCFSSILHFVSSWCIFLAVALHFERHLTLPFTPPYPWSSTMHISYQPSENWVTFLYAADICHLRHPQCWRTFFKIAYNSSQETQKGLFCLSRELELPAMVPVAQSPASSPSSRICKYKYKIRFISTWKGLSSFIKYHKISITHISQPNW